MEVMYLSCLIFLDHMTMKVSIWAFASLALLSKEQWVGLCLLFILFSGQNIPLGDFLWNIDLFCQHSKVLENFIEKFCLILLYFDYSVCAALSWNGCVLQMRLIEDCILESPRGNLWLIGLLQLYICKCTLKYVYAHIYINMYLCVLLILHIYTHNPK